MKYILIFFTYIFSNSVNAKLPTFCKSEYIHKVKSQIEYGQSRSFNYYYQKAASSKGVVTFIIIPGGPGGTSISDYDPKLPFDFQKILWGLPEKSNVIYTDPRDSGCNSSSSLPENSFSTLNVAGDILNIIVKEKLTDYVIMGHSYGTLVATVLSNLLSKKNILQPHSIILSGTLGKYFDKGQRYYGYNIAWERLRLDLPVKLKRLFPVSLTGDDIENFNFPFNISADKWLTFISNGLTEGANYIGGVKQYNLERKLLYLISNDPRKIKDLKAEVEKTSTVSKLSESKFFNAIYCNEIEEGNEDCIKKGYTQFSRPYDSLNYQIKSNIIYFQGAHDPAVPLDKAIYHFNRQRNQNFKIMYSLEQGGHTTALMINDCKEWFWKKLFKNDFEALESLSEKCPGQIEVKVNY